MTLAEPLRRISMLPATKEPAAMFTVAARSAPTLPAMRAPRASSVASVATHRLPLTSVPSSQHVAPAGTCRLSALACLKYPAQISPPARAGGAAMPRAATATQACTIFPTLIEPPVPCLKAFQRTSLGGLRVGASVARRCRSRPRAAGRLTLIPNPKESENASHGHGQGQQGQRSRRDAQRGVAARDGQLQRGTGQGRHHARRGGPASQLQGRAGA